MFDAGLAELGLKMAATAAVVVIACLLVERAGPVIGGLIATLPISAGPGFVFLAMEHDAAFIGDSARGGIRALAATTAFVSTYAVLAPRTGLAGGLGVALLVWAGVVAATGWATLGIWGGALVYLAVFVPCFLATRRARAFRPAAVKGGRRWDIPVRAGAAMALVAVVLALGRLFGPAAAGVAALAPIVMTSLAVLLYPRVGAAGAASVLANALPGMFGNAVAVVVLNLTAVALGSAASLLLALGICVVWNAGLAGLSRRR